MNDAVLEVAALSKGFGGVQALRDVSFNVAAGQMTALIGPNGAGKTTCFNLINGQIAPDDGVVRLRGERIDGLAPRSIAHKGVSRTFQVAATFASMTVRENVELAIAAHANRDGLLFDRQRRGSRDGAERLLARTGIAAHADRHCATLPYGALKRVELALALANFPSLLLMDEPTAGTAHAERSELMRLPADLAREEGLAVLFTEHDMDVVFEFADRVIVLDRGSIIADGKPDDIRRNSQVQAVYLGTGDGTPGQRG
jgi:branched-chain amino acid transport system ATP-binding protein